MTDTKTTAQSWVSHGLLPCVRCWNGIVAKTQDVGDFRLVRDPGHAGSSDPTILVLGISKGSTQSKEVETGDFDNVPFKGMRPRLLRVLQTAGFLPGETIEQFDLRFRATELYFGFGSVVRCSLTGMDRKKGAHTAASPNVIRALRPGATGYAFASACVDQHIGKLPRRTGTVLLLGNTSSYTRDLRTLIGDTLGGVTPVNDVAYQAGRVLFVHVPHPSGANGHFENSMRGEGLPGMKMRLATEALGSWKTASEKRRL